MIVARIYISIVFFLFVTISKSQNIEPENLIGQFVVSILRNDTINARKLINEDSLNANFYIVHSVKPSDSLRKSSILFMYRLAFFSTWNILFISNDDLDNQKVYIKNAEFKIVKYEADYLEADYYFKLLSKSKANLRCKMRYINNEWKIVSVKVASLKY